MILRSKDCHNEVFITSLQGTIKRPQRIIPLVPLFFGFIIPIKDLLLKKLEVVPLLIQLMTPNGAIWSLNQRTVIMR